MKKEEELASTNKLLQIIRGDTESQQGEKPEKDLTLTDFTPSDDTPPVKTLAQEENKAPQIFDEFDSPGGKEDHHS